MSKYIGRLVDVGIGRETTRGAGAEPTYHLPLTSLSFDDKVTKARSSGSLSKLEDSEEAFVTTQYSQGDMEGEIRAKSFGHILYAMLGSHSVTGPSDEAYTHSFSLSHSNQHQSLALVVEEPNTTELYKLVMLETLEIMAELDEIVKYSASFISKKATSTALTVPAVVTEPKFTKKHLRFKVADSIANLGAATAISLKSLSISFQKNTAIDDVLGTAEPEDILNHQLSIEGEITINYEDETWKNYMKNNTSRAMEIAFINNDETIGSGSVPPSLTIRLPKVDFFDWEPDYTLDEIVTQTISFKASRDVENNADAISLCNLANDVTTY